MYSLEYEMKLRTSRGKSRELLEQMLNVPEENSLVKIADRSNIQKLPIIIILNGAGAVGKDTFVDDFTDAASANSRVSRVMRLSTVDLVYTAVNKVLLMEDIREDGDHVRASIQKSVKKKDDPWRQFMNDVKMAWSRYCDGPRQYIMNRVIDIVKTNRFIEYIFIYSRESPEINSFVELFNNAGFLVTTLFMYGRKNAEDWQNDCDGQVADGKVHYDYQICNTGTLEDLNAEAVEYYKKLSAIYESEYYDNWIYSETK